MMKNNLRKRILLVGYRVMILCILINVGLKKIVRVFSHAFLSLHRSRLKAAPTELAYNGGLGKSKKDKDFLHTTFNMTFEIESYNNLL